MKRFWIGICLLVGLLAVTVGISVHMNRVHMPMAQQLRQAAEAALQEDWQQAAVLADRARQSWEKNWHCTAVFADHTPMDEMDGLFAELKVYGRVREKEHFAATCDRLAKLAEAMADSHHPGWWNLL